MMKLRGSSSSTILRTSSWVRKPPIPQCSSWYHHHPRKQTSLLSSVSSFSTTTLNPPSHYDDSRSSRKPSVRSISSSSSLVDDSIITTKTNPTTTKTKAVVDLPDHANVVIIGGGIIGTSVAYHLGKLGVPNVLLLERHQLTSGTTWHAAGLLTTFGSLSSTSMAMRSYTKELYRDILPQETGLETGFMDVGFIELASGPVENSNSNSNPSREGLDRLHYFRRVAAFNRLCGIPVEELTPDTIQRDYFPFLDTTGVLAGFHVPCDGRVNPTDATMALAKGARQYGVQLQEGVSVTGITTTSATERGAGLKTVTGVTVALPPASSLSSPTSSSGPTMSQPASTDPTPTSTHVIQANVVVNCAGMWARQLGELCGVTIPNQAAEHYYLLTDAIEGLDPRAPVLEDPSHCMYVRPEGTGLLIGFFEWDGAPWKASGIPQEFAFGEIEPDWDRMTPYLELALQRFIPELRETLGIKKLFCGPESFTPDGNPIVGPAPHLKNYYVAAGMNSIGILTGGGIGKTLAQWIVNDGVSPTDMDVTGIHIHRFHKYQSNPTYRNDRVGESLGDTYRLLYPHHQPKTCRGAKQSPFHERLTTLQAKFRDVSGWESPAWYATSSSTSSSSLMTLPEESFGRCHWFPHWEAEHLACRNNVALFDMSFMSKFLVQGVDAGSFLNRLSTAHVNGEIGTITYTQWLNELGYLEADLTVTKLDDDQFLVVATDTMHHHVQAHMTRRLTRKDHVVVTDMTARYAQLNLQGPHSRRVLQQLTSRDMSHEAFPFRHVEEIEMGLARVLCARITYVGELGYELFIPVEQAVHVYDQICHVGRDLGLRHAGLRALGSLRMEKGYRDYGHDIDNTDTILEAGLSFTCDFEKDGGFIGQEHVLAEKARNKERGGMTRRMANVLVPLMESDPLLYHGEVIWRNGNERISDIRSASYGHTVKGGVGLTMLDSRATGGQLINKEYIDNASWEVEIANERYPCQIKLTPFYDPKNTRIKI